MKARAERPLEVTLLYVSILKGQQYATRPLLRLRGPLLDLPRYRHTALCAGAVNLYVSELWYAHGARSARRLFRRATLMPGTPRRPHESHGVRARVHRRTAYGGI